MKPLEQLTRRLTLTELGALPKQTPSKRLFKSHPDDDAGISVMSETFNIVLSRNLRKNTRLAAEIAADIAMYQQDRDVWYLNTYAGVGLLQESFADALEMPMAFIREHTILP